MEIANIPVPTAAVPYQFIVFLNHDTTYISYYSKNHNMTLLWDRFCLLQLNLITMKEVKAY
jgi:hypothetical protein